MPVNITAIKTSSNGAWQGDNPLDFAFPLLIVQIILILAVSRFLGFLFKPLRQPKVIAEIVVSLSLSLSRTHTNTCMPSLFDHLSLCFREEFCSDRRLLEETNTTCTEYFPHGALRYLNPSPVSVSFSFYFS